MPRSFKTRYCELYDCKPDDFPRKVLWRLLYPHAVPVVWLLSKLSDQFLRKDLHVAEQLGHVKSGQEISLEANDLRRDYQRTIPTFRNILLLRISGKRMIRLGKTVFEATHRNGEAGGAE